MKKSELKAKYYEFNKEISNHSGNDDTLKRLMDLNEEFGDGSRWCSWDANMVGIAKHGNKHAIKESLEIYAEHIRIETEKSILFRIMDETNNMNI